MERVRYNISIALPLGRIWGRWTAKCEGWRWVLPPKRLVTNISCRPCRPGTFIAKILLCLPFAFMQGHFFLLYFLYIHNFGLVEIYIYIYIFKIVTLFLIICTRLNLHLYLSCFKFQVKNFRYVSFKSYSFGTTYLTIDIIH